MPLPVVLVATQLLPVGMRRFVQSTSIRFYFTLRNAFRASKQFQMGTNSHNTVHFAIAASIHFLPLSVSAAMSALQALFDSELG